MKIEFPWVVIITLWVIGAACLTQEKNAEKKAEKVPARSATGKNFRLAVKICKPYGGVSFVESGEKFKAECRDGLEVSKKIEVKK